MRAGSMPLGGKMFLAELVPPKWALRAPLNGRVTPANVQMLAAQSLDRLDRLGGELRVFTV